MGLWFDTASNVASHTAVVLQVNRSDPYTTMYQRRRPRFAFPSPVVGARGLPSVRSLLLRGWFLRRLLCEPFLERVTAEQLVLRLV